jgi:flagellar motor protein MotB
MNRLALTALPLLAVATLAGGCQNRLHDENLSLFEENRALRTELERVQGGSVDGQTVIDLQNQLAQSQAEADSLRMQLDAQPASDSMQMMEVPDIAGTDTSFDPDTGELTVAVAGDVLFGSGRSDLKESSLQTLDNVVAALQNDYAGNPVRVEGHTDADPVTKTVGLYTDNFGLASARALTVMRYLKDQGIDPARLSAAAYGEHQPRSDDKADNRRVEIVVLTR